MTDRAELEAMKRLIDRHRRPDFTARLEANIAKHKPLLDRLAREGDCRDCRGTEAGCDKHRGGEP